MSSTFVGRGRKYAWRLALGVSLALHVLVLLVVRDLWRLPKLDLQFQLPSEVEFGVVEAPAHAAPSEPQQQQTPQTPPAKPKAKPAQRTARTPKIKSRQPRGPTEQALPAALAAAGGAAKFAPKGTQVALRLDLQRIRKSPLAAEADELLRAIPDVRALLDGSGIDPVRDLSRLFLASPDLRREHVVMAGRYTGDDSVPKHAVEQLAQQKGLAAVWRKQRGIPTAPWHNQDSTARVVALLGPNLFAITRPDDLARVLAVAHAAHLSRPTDTAVGDELVHMAERELLNIAVEDARAFVRGPRGQLAPDRLVVSVRQQAGDPQRLHIEASARYPDVAQADTAMHYWANLRDRYASHPLVALMGFDRLLKQLRLTRERAQLTATTIVPPRQARLLLRFVGDSVRGPEPLEPAAKPISAP